jgi:hypothetical protein
MRVYYMTSMKWAEVILKERRFKLSRFYESNDPFELKLIDSRPAETRKYASLIADYYNKTIGMICFGADWASPVMWAHYAEKHTGVCFGLDVDDALLTKVAYSDEKIAVPFGAHLPKFGLSAELLTRIVSTKATAWSYEREYRVMGNLLTQDPSTGLYYTDFGPQVQLREIVIGYRCTWSIAITREMAGEVDAPVRICKARPAFGKFKMVEQQQVKPVTIKPLKRRS